MANEKISQLTDGSPALGADQIPVNRAGTNYRVNASTIHGGTNALYATDFGVVADVQTSYNATYTQGSTTVTTLSTDPPFKCPGNSFPCSTPGAGSDVGKVVFGVGNCNENFVNTCEYDVPVGVISTVTNAHTITVSRAALHTNSANASSNILFWGTDDGPALAAAFAAMTPVASATFTQPQTSLYLPCGAMFTSVPPFVVGANGVNNGGNIYGCGSGAPVIPLPTMNCTGGAGKGCLFWGAVDSMNDNGNYLPGWHLSDITFWGGGTDVADSVATITTGTAGVYTNTNDHLTNVWVVGWLWNNAANPVEGLHQYGGGVYINSGSVSGGTTACVSEAALWFSANWIGGDCGDSQGDSFLVKGNQYMVNTTKGMVINQSHGTHIGVHVISGTWEDTGSDVTYNATIDGANALAILTGTTLNEYGFGAPPFIVKSGIVKLHSATFLAVGVPSIDQTGGIIFDNGGNILPTAPTITNLFGCASVAGIADVAGNHVLTSGWGTASVGSVTGSVNDVKFTITISGGSPSPSPVLTDTFAVQYWATPGGGCSLIQVGGTFGDISNPAESTLAATGVTWTFAGTPVSGHSYTFVRHCGN